jgi:hypothetical protein
MIDRQRPGQRSWAWRIQFEIDDALAEEHKARDMTATHCTVPKTNRERDVVVSSIDDAGQILELLNSRADPHVLLDE